MPTTSEKMLMQDAQEELKFLETNLSASGLSYSTKKIRAFIEDCYEKHDKYLLNSEKFHFHLITLKVFYFGIPILFVIYLFFPKIQAAIEYIQKLP